MRRTQEKQGRLRDEDAFVRGQGIAVGCRRRIAEGSQRWRLALSQRFDEDNTATGRWEQRPAQRQKFSGPWKSHGRGSLRPCAPPIDPSPPQQPRSPTASTTASAIVPWTTAFIEIFCFASRDQRDLKTWLENWKKEWTLEGGMLGGGKGGRSWYEVSKTECHAVQALCGE